MQFCPHQSALTPTTLNFYQSLSTPDCNVCVCVCVCVLLLLLVFFFFFGGGGVNHSLTYSIFFFLRPTPVFIIEMVYVAVPACIADLPPS